MSIQSADEILTLLGLIRLDGSSEFALEQIERFVRHRDAKVREAAIETAVAFGPEAAPVADAFWKPLLDAKPQPKAHTKLPLVQTLLAIESQPHEDNWTEVLTRGEPVLVADAVRSWRAFRDRPNMLKVLANAAPELLKRQPDLQADLAAVALAFGEAWNVDLELPDHPGDDASYQQFLTSERMKQANPHLGRRVFERTGCVKCHTTVTRNTERAPSLKGIGKGQKIEYLIESVLAPSEVIKTGFETETVVTNNGKIYTGLVHESDDGLRILTADDEIQVSKDDVDERTIQKQSLMPQGQHRTLSHQEFADLIAYLQSLR